MRQALTGVGVVVLLSGAALGQTITAAAPPTFDVADVHVSPKGKLPYMTGGVLRGTRYDARNASMLDLIRTAYNVDDDSKIQGGPSWLDTDRFDIIAQTPATTSQDSVRLMLQALLADRFKLVVRTEKKPMPVFVLTMGKGKPKMKESDGKGLPGCQGQPTPPPEPGAVPYSLVTCHGMTMDAFATQVHNFGGGYLDHPVLNQTGLEGTWDFDLKWTGRGVLSAAGADGISIFDAVDKQLGLKLEASKTEIPVIAIASVNQKPTDNPPDVITKLPPPPPTEFEVADIKPSKPDANMNGRLQPGGRLDLQAFPLKVLIQIAWDINNPDDMISGPKFLDSAKFDVIAKTSTTTNGPADAPQVDIDDVRVMLRALLIDRFKMKVHTEDRPVSGFVLTAPAGKTKLQKADPSNRTGCHEGPGADGKDPRIATPILTRLLTCQNMTIAQLAEMLPLQANGYVHTPVLDSTGIEGAFDITLSFSAIGALQNGLPGQPGGTSDPSGGLSLPDAVYKQLGLKMELQKRPMPVLVIDHAEEKPTGN